MCVDQPTICCMINNIWIKLGGLGGRSQLYPVRPLLEIQDKLSHHAGVGLYATSTPTSGGNAKLTSIACCGNARPVRVLLPCGPVIEITFDARANCYPWPWSLQDCCGRVLSFGADIRLSIARVMQLTEFTYNVPWWHKVWAKPSYINYTMTSFWAFGSLLDQRPCYSTT